MSKALPRNQSPRLPGDDWWGRKVRFLQPLKFLFLQPQVKDTSRGLIRRIYLFCATGNQARIGNRQCRELHRSKVHGDT